MQKFLSIVIWLQILIFCSENLKVSARVLHISSKESNKMRKILFENHPFLRNIQLSENMQTLLNEKPAYERLKRVKRIVEEVQNHPGLYRVDDRLFEVRNGKLEPYKYRSMPDTQKPLKQIVVKTMNIFPVMLTESSVSKINRRSKEYKELYHRQDDLLDEPTTSAKLLETTNIPIAEPANFHTMSSTFSISSVLEDSAKSIVTHSECNTARPDHSNIKKNIQQLKDEDVKLFLDKILSQYMDISTRMIRDTHLSLTTECSKDHKERVKRLTYNTHKKKSAENDFSSSEREQNFYNSTQILTDIVKDLQELMVKRQFNRECSDTAEGFPCKANGSWASEIGSMRLNINGKYGTNLNITLDSLDEKPVKRGFLALGTWNINGFIPEKHHELITLTAADPQKKIVATFTGQCKVCENKETIFGSWLFLKSAFGCNTINSCQSVIKDMWYREYEPTVQTILPIG